MALLPCSDFLVSRSIRAMITITITVTVTVLGLKVVDCESTLMTDSCENCTLLFPNIANQNESDAGKQLEQAEFKNTTTELRKDKIFSLDSAIFEKYLAGFDWSIVPGYGPEDDFENWIVPDVIKKNIPPIYMSGFDSQNRPIWIMQYGKHNYKKFATGGPAMRKLFHKYIRYTTYVARKSMAIRSTDEHRVEQMIWIIDFEGVTPQSLLNPDVLSMQLEVVSDYRRYSEAYFYKIIGLNVNLVSENLLNLGRFFLLRLLDKFVVYGTNRAWWVPQLLKILPKESIPEKYGGVKGAKPLYTIF